MLGRVRSRLGRSRLAGIRARLVPAEPAPPPTPLKEAADARAPLSTLPPRADVPFAREHVAATYQFGVEIEGRLYNYVVYPGTGDALCVHFSAFFGDWGERAEHRDQFQGYFHRLRMFWPLREHTFVFLCDTFGADRNGTYYKGEDNDFFVERATETIIEDVRTQLGTPRDRVVALGSSMGATVALRLALKHQYAGAVAVSPHIDLDLCARFQGRQRHVAALLGVEDVEAPEHFAVTREIRELAAAVPPRPRLVLQSAEDDHGVHVEQVEPLVALWRSRGGATLNDFRPDGGHTSDRATPEFFREAIAWCLLPSSPAE
jgi:pimeloyl-ACP methyl ester carboxylesterase